MEFIDISVPIHATMPVWPNDAGVEIERVRRIEDGANANVSRYSLGSHTGTHIDPPLHFLRDGAPVDELPLEVFLGSALVIEPTPVGPHITAMDLEAADISAGTRRVLLKTRNGELWEGGGFREDFVGLEEDAGRWLTERGVRLVGIDYLSVAPFGRSTPVHTQLLANGCFVLEGLDLRGVEPGEYTLACFPLRVVGGDGSPVRAVLIRD